MVPGGALGTMDRQCVATGTLIEVSSLVEPEHVVELEAEAVVS